MRTFITTTTLLLFFWQASAQDTSQMKKWQEEHPHKIVMSLENYNALDSTEQQQIQPFIVLLDTNDLSTENLERFDDSENLAEQFESENFVKRWLAANGSVKIVKRSEYLSANAAQKALYKQSHILVLEGEEITRRDIENY